MFEKREQRVIAILGAIPVILIANSCSTGPQPAKMGTPPFYWLAAKETFTAADYVKTNNHLEQLTKSDNEFTSRALPWRLVLTAGMTKGYAELADTYEAGARANKINPTPFRRQTADYRSTASSLALQFVETFLKFSKTRYEQNIPLAFSFPTGSATPIQELSKISFGAALPPTVAESVPKRVIERAVVLAACDAVGAQDDVAKAQAVFRSENPQAPNDVFMVALAKTLFDQSVLFSRTKLDRSDRVELFCNQALEALKNVKETKETKDLTGKIRGTLKGLRSGRA